MPARARCAARFASRTSRSATARAPTARRPGRGRASRARAGTPSQARPERRECGDGADRHRRPTARAGPKLALGACGTSPSTVEAGQLVALVGPSGAGKTTFHLPDPAPLRPPPGRVLLDGDDLRELSLHGWPTRWGSSPRKPTCSTPPSAPTCFTPAPNVTHAELEPPPRLPTSTISSSACPKATRGVVGERGDRLTGGERQRLALARVIPRNPRLLVLDEATSHLDSELEVLIIQECAQACHGPAAPAWSSPTVSAPSSPPISSWSSTAAVIVERGTHAQLQVPGWPLRPSLRDAVPYRRPLHRADGRRTRTSSRGRAGHRIKDRGLKATTRSPNL